MSELPQRSMEKPDDPPGRTWELACVRGDFETETWIAEGEPFPTCPFCGGEMEVM